MVLAALACLLLMNADTPAQLPPGVTAERDLVYATVDGRELRLDAYWHPDAPEPAPLVVWVHGGAWRRGSKANPRALWLLSKGYAVASVEYRLSPEAIFPAQIHDCKAAVRWLRANADRYNVDPERFGAWGPSAGGHLVALLGTSGDVAALEGTLGVTGVSSRVQAVCDWFGPTDLLRMNDVKGRIDHDAPDSPESMLIGAPIQDHPDKVAKANPITYVTADDPPFLLMHGSQDFTVIKNQSELLHDALQRADVSSNLILIDDQGHGFSTADRDRDHILRHVEAFFDRELRDRQSAWTSHDANPHPWVTDFGRNAPRSRDVLFYSKTLGGYTGYTVYLPEGYEESDRDYPVVYWLHGRGGRPHSANRFIARAHRAIAAGKCPEMLIVSPTGLRGSMWVDSPDGTQPVESVILNDFIPHVEATYRVIPDRASRAIDGFSMGGFGAAHLGFKHPDLFGTISLMGAAIHRPEFFRDNRADIFAKAFGGDLAYCTAESPWTLVKTAAPRLKGRTLIRLYVGENDTRLRDKNVEFSTLMTELGLDHEHAVVPEAAHNAAQVLDGLGDKGWLFFSRAFKGSHGGHGTHGEN